MRRAGPVGRAVGVSHPHTPVGYLGTDESGASSTLRHSESVNDPLSCGCRADPRAVFLKVDQAKASRVGQFSDFDVGGKVQERGAAMGVVAEQKDQFDCVSEDQSPVVGGSFAQEGGAAVFGGVIPRHGVEGQVG